MSHVDRGSDTDSLTVRLDGARGLGLHNTEWVEKIADRGADGDVAMELSSRLENSFPFTPNSIQVDFMKALYTGEQREFVKENLNRASM